MVGKPYRVAGRTYVPRDYSSYSAVGMASWYGRDFHGRRTANGEVYDMADLTAAHPTLPLPSYARVTNLANGRSVVVRINDRGPYTRGRLIDVSATVAALLDFKRAGSARVKVDYVGPARMDGLDRKMLMASYRAPGSGSNDTLFAAAPPVRVRPAVILVSAPQRKLRPAPDFSIANDPMVITPAYVPAAADGDGDPLAPLILRTGFASSYAPAGRLSPAHEAAASLADAGQQAAVARVALESGAVSGGGAIVQLGAFSDPINATRIGDRFGRFGRVVMVDRVSGDRTLRSVRIVIVDPSVDPAEVIAAATDAGLSGAFLVSQ
jgi:rare lipoprotein A